MKLAINAILIIFLSPVLVFSQSNYGNITTQFSKEDQSLIKNALEGSIYILRQEYVLKSTNASNTKEYGKGSNAYFGKIYGFGVLSNKRLWTDSKIKTPWLYDKNFTESEKSDTLKPVISKLSIKNPGGKVFIMKSFTYKDSVKSKDTSKHKITFNKNIFFYELKDTIKTVRTEKSCRDTLGWLVIATSKEDLSKNDSVPFNIGVYRVNLHFNDSTNEALISKMPVTDNIIGGAFFTTSVTPGRIDLMFAGIVTKKLLNWYVEALPENMSAINKGDIGTAPKGN